MTSLDSDPCVRKRRVPSAQVEAKQRHILGPSLRVGSQEGVARARGSGEARADALRLPRPQILLLVDEGGHRVRRVGHDGGAVKDHLVVEDVVMRVGRFRTVQVLW